MKTLTLLILTLALSGCAGIPKNDLKSPCAGKHAGLNDNPCNPLPINIG